MQEDKGGICMKEQVRRIFAVLLAVIIVAGALPYSASASENRYTDTPYQKADTIVDGETYVFFSHITNNLEKSDPANRLLTADYEIPENINGTSTTNFSIDENGILWGKDGDLKEYRFVITEVPGAIDEGNQGYTIKQASADGKYLGVTQTYQLTRQDGCTIEFFAGSNTRKFDGSICPTLAFVYLADGPCTWYWEEGTHQFYARYTSDLSSLGTEVKIVTNGTMYMQSANGRFDLIYWQGNHDPYNFDISCPYTYVDEDDLLGYTGYTYNTYGGNYKLYLGGVNSGNEKQDYYANNLAEVLHNPYYYLCDQYPTLGKGGCASLSVKNGDADLYDAAAEWSALTLYRQIPSYELTVDGGSGTGVYLSDEKATISADAYTDSGHFVRWEVTSGTCTIDDPGSPSTTATLSSNAEIRPVYESHTLPADDGDCTTEVKCSKCDYVATQKYDTHSYGSYTNPEPGKHVQQCTNSGCTKKTQTGECASSKAATCLSPQVCDVCGSFFGEKDPNNHVGDQVWQQTETTHKRTYNCCGAVTVGETEHTWENGICTVCGYVCQHRGGKASYFAQAVCETCGSGYGPLAIDGTAPTGEIKVSGNVWSSFQDTADHELFFDGAQQVEITASDDSYSHMGFTDDESAKIEYYLHTSDIPLAEEELGTRVFTEYDGAFVIEPDSQYVIYARITDHAGNVTYISSDSLVLDGTAPAGIAVNTNGYTSGEWLTAGDVTITVSGAQALSGIAKYQYSADGGLNWTDMTSTDGSALIVISDETAGTDYIFRAVSNTGLTSEAEPVTVKIDRTAPEGDIRFEENSVKKLISEISFNLLFNENVDVEISGVDNLSGVARIEYHRSDKALTVSEVGALNEWTETNGRFSITAEDKASFIYYVKVTDNADNVTCFGSDGATFDLTPPAISGVANGGTYYVSQAVTVSDENLDAVTVNGAAMTDPTFVIAGNTDQVYRVTATDKAGNATEYTVTMKTIASLGEGVDGLTAGNVTLDDKEAIDAVKDEIVSMNVENATEDEKAALQDVNDSCDRLLEKIEEVSQAVNTESVQRVEDVTPDNVSLEDKEELQAAKEDLEKALEDYADNLTEEEKAAIEEDIERIESSLESIEKVAAVEGVIGRLPDTVEPDDVDAEQIINDAKEQYDALTVHEKALVNEEAKERLDSLLAGLVDYKVVEGDGNKWEKGGGTALSFIANGAYSKFTGIEVDGKPVDQANYVTSSGSTIIVLKPDYLETLSVGKHTLTVRYADGEASCEFEIYAKEGDVIPKTGDSSTGVPLAAFMLAAGAALIGAALHCRKMNHGM